MSPLGRPFQDRCLSTDAVSLIISSWRESNQRQYKPYLKRWEDFCRTRAINSISRSVEDGVNFLAEQLYRSRIGYSAINTAGSALSTVCVLPGGVKFGSHPLVTRIMKGVFEERPSLRRYKDTWNIDTVLKYLANLGPPKTMTLKNLTQKLGMLMALLSGQRRQTLHACDVEAMDLTSDSCTFVITTLFKTSRPGRHLPPIRFVQYKPDERLCIIRPIEEYVRRTKSLRGNESKLLISYQRPHKAVSKDTLSRWFKAMLQQAGIDTSRFGAHSTRSASTSVANALNMPIDIILNSGGWSQESTFAKYYNMPIEVNENCGSTLLQNYH